MSVIFLLQILAFAIVFWLGTYLFGRDPANYLTRYTGLGCIFYAVSLAIITITTLNDAPPELSDLTTAHLIFPPLYWAGALIHLRDNRLEPSNNFSSLYRRLIVPLGWVAYSALLLSKLITTANPTPQSTVLILSPWLILPLLTGLIVLPKSWRAIGNNKTVGAVIAATLFFTLGSGMVIFPLAWLPPLVLYLGIAFDFILLGVAIAWLDAFDLGERLLPDMIRAFLVSAIFTLLFAAQIVFIIGISTGPTFIMVFVLHITTAVSIMIANQIDNLQHFIEQIITKKSFISRKAPDYRALSSSAVKLNPDIDLQVLDDETFFRYTRQALSSFGDLPKLTKNPLIQLQGISEKLRAAGEMDIPLERAKILKSVLTDSVLRLKPVEGTHFNDTDEWRHYNSLYFPYLLGLKPYSRRNIKPSQLDENAQKALTWFQRFVPERTLYNWQSAAAELIAQNLKELL